MNVKLTRSPDRRRWEVRDSETRRYIGHVEKTLFGGETQWLAFDSCGDYIEPPVRPTLRRHAVQLVVEADS